MTSRALKPASIATPSLLSIWFRSARAVTRSTRRTARRRTDDVTAHEATAWHRLGATRPGAGTGGEGAHARCCVPPVVPRVPVCSGP